MSSDSSFPIWLNAGRSIITLKLMLGFFGESIKTLLCNGELLIHMCLFRKPCMAIPVKCYKRQKTEKKKMPAGQKKVN